MRLTRRYHFSASHRLHSPSLTESQNASVYGKCNNPFGHGHNYVLEVTAAGRVDRNSALLLPIAKLDELVQQKVLHVIAHRNLNLDLPQFVQLVPTTENLALVIVDILQKSWTSYIGNFAVRLSRVRLEETERNSFEVLIDSSPHSPTESALVNA